MESYFLLDLLREIFDSSRVCGAAGSPGGGLRKEYNSVFVPNALVLQYDPFRLEASLHKRNLWILVGVFTLICDMVSLVGNDVDFGWFTICFMLDIITNSNVSLPGVVQVI